MTSQRDLERALDSFFEMGADEVANRVIDDALVTIEHTPQRRAMRVPWRSSEMPRSLKLATVAVAVILAISGTAWMLGGGPGPGRRRRAAARLGIAIGHAVAVAAAVPVSLADAVINTREHDGLAAVHLEPPRL